MEKFQRKYSKRPGTFAALALTFTAIGVACAAKVVHPQSTADVLRRIRISGPTAPVKEGEIFYVTVHSSKRVAEITGSFATRHLAFFPDGTSLSPTGMREYVYSAIVGAEDGMGNSTPELNVIVCTENLTPTASNMTTLAGTVTYAQNDAPTSAPMPVEEQTEPLAAEERKSDANAPAKVVPDRKSPAMSCSDHGLGVHIQAGVFPSETLKVPPRTVEPSPKDQIRIAKEQKILNAVYAATTRKRYWDPPAVMPVRNPVTSVWGTRRVYNGHVQGAHYGTDLRAPIGTPIAAPLSGRIALSRRLFFTGNTVIMDHGYGLFTIYGHMSKLRVKQGQIIKKGKVLGLAGMTGRANGPHLHWGVKLHQAKIDPVALVRAIR